MPLPWLRPKGARLWNAATSLEVRPSGLVAEADSVSVCLSKGLGAPVGSVLVGSEKFIYQVCSAALPAARCTSSFRVFHGTVS